MSLYKTRLSINTFLREESKSARLKPIEHPEAQTSSNWGLTTCRHVVCDDSSFKANLAKLAIGKNWLLVILIQAAFSTGEIFSALEVARLSGNDSMTHFRHIFDDE